MVGVKAKIKVSDYNFASGIVVRHLCFIKVSSRPAVKAKDPQGCVFELLACEIALITQQWRMVSLAGENDG